MQLRLVFGGRGMGRPQFMVFVLLEVPSTNPHTMIIGKPATRFLFQFSCLPLLDLGILNLRDSYPSGWIEIQ